MNTIIVFSDRSGSRLEYVLEWLFRERIQLDYRVTNNIEETANLPFFIAYGCILPNALTIPDIGLLWQKGVQVCNPEKGTWNGIPVIFPSDEKNYSLPFDLFSAIFYLLCRYEEYYQDVPDKHDRYPVTESILYRNGWLRRPLADEWIVHLKKIISGYFSIRDTGFDFQLTYDIDIAYSYQHKGISRTTGAYLKDILQGNIRQIIKRTGSLLKIEKDPFDSFEWLHELHKSTNSKPIYFILASLKTTEFDKNIHPGNSKMQQLIRHLNNEGIAGIHPSYFSDRGNTLTDEKNFLEKITGKSIQYSRQHYIKLKMPETYRLLIDLGITDDFSMGYATALGFRAGTGTSFLWYDIQNELTTNLRIHPFCFMDTTAHFEEKLSVEDSFHVLNAMKTSLVQTGSKLISIFHNFSLGADREWKGWREEYRAFVELTS